MIKKRYLQIYLFVGLSQIVIGCSDVDTAAKPIERNEPLSAEIKHPPHEPATVEAQSPSVENTAVSRSAESHVHGGAILSVVSENGGIIMELETPLYNLIGFEYAPQSNEEKAQLAAVEKLLGQPSALVKFNDEAQCTYGTLKNGITLFPKKTSNQADHHHSHHKKESHEERHEHDKAHKDITLTYSAKCANLEGLETIEALFFKNFPNMTDVELVYLGPSQQIGTELSPSKSTADLTR